MNIIEDLLKACNDTEEAAAEQLRKSQMAFDFTAPAVGNPHDHHKAYTRTNAAGTVSQIKEKGVQRQPVKGDRAWHQEAGYSAGKSHAAATFNPAGDWSADMTGLDRAWDALDANKRNDISRKTFEFEFGRGYKTKASQMVNDALKIKNDHVTSQPSVKQEDKTMGTKYKGHTIERNDMSGLGFASYWSIDGGTPGKNSYPTLKAAKTHIDGLTASEQDITHFKGDKAVYTGKKETLHGGEFHEVKILEGRFKGQTKLVAKGPSKTSDEAAGAKLADEMATLGQKHLGDPKGLIDAIVKREFGKLEYRQGNGVMAPLELRIKHDSNMVTIGYKAETAGRGEAVSIGGKNTMTGQSIENQRKAFENYARGIETELKNCGIRVEDSSVENGTLFFVSDDMIPRNK